MANLIITPSIFTKMVLMELGGYLNVTKSMSSEYTKEFANKTYKVGATVGVRKPQIFQVTTGLNFQPQAITNLTTPVTVDTPLGVHYQWDAIEKTLSLMEVQKMYAVPAAKALASYINNQAAIYVAQNTFNLSGTPGAAATTMAAYLQPADKLIELGLPENEELACIISRRMSSSYANAVSTLFNPGGVIGGQYEKGWVNTQALGYKWKFDQTLWRQTYGTYAGTPLINGASQTADGGNNATMTLVTDGWSSGASTLNKGDVFTIADVYSVHPQTKQSTGRLAQFVVTATISDTTGSMSPIISPAITPTGQYQNVSAAAADNAAITVAGTTGVVSEQGIVMHKDAFAFVSVPLENPPEGAGAECTNVTDPDTGVSLSHCIYFDGNTRTTNVRLDALIGFAPLYREMACRIASN